ncbi:uncharacterized protein [Hemitrygon akajei]|uniref:uncharacterized protein n=1 Tax=Hemitrygon akajei TaxID=2704970 RepID=UPI003BF95459
MVVQEAPIFFSLSQKAEMPLSFLGDSVLVSGQGQADQLKSSLDSLTKKKSDFQEKEQQQKEKISGVREQSHSLQSHITSQFAELRQIITEKEQSLLRDVREEEKRILNPMEKTLLALQENIRSIQEEISKLKEQMDQKDSVIFLKEEARRNRRINDDVQALAVTDEAQPFEKFDHPYLLKTVLRETLDDINRGVNSGIHSVPAPPGVETTTDAEGALTGGYRGRCWTSAATSMTSEGSPIDHTGKGAEGAGNCGHQKYWCILDQ